MKTKDRAHRFAHIKKIQFRYALVSIGVPVLFVLAAIPVGLFFGISSLDLGLTFGMYCLSIFGIGAGYHRYATHRGFTCPDWFKAAILILGSTAGEGPLIFWVATHRAHHKFSDQPGDPHSPHSPAGSWLARAWHAHIGWMFTEQPVNPRVYAPDLLKDSISFWINRRYFSIMAVGILAPGLIAVAVTHSLWAGASAIFWAGIVRIFLVQNATWAVNSVCHLIGARPNQNREQSTNNFVVAILTMGEGWHNNHHASPSAALHGWWKWYQVDATGAMLKAFGLLGLVRDIKGRPILTRVPAPAPGLRMSPESNGTAEKQTLVV
jgi:stearoyl-CoA desaturase (Delta-9 desaturase)